MNSVISLIKFFSFDLLKDFLYFPIWWYTIGLKSFVKANLRSIRNEEKRLGLRIWILNIFNPMYSQYDWKGRIISFFIRLIQIIIRSAILISWSFFIFMLLILYLALPWIVLYQVVYQMI